MRKSNLLNKELKRLRIARGLSQKDVSKKFGLVSSQFISNIERGRAPIPPKYLSRFAKLFKADQLKLRKLFEQDLVNNVKYN